MKFSDSVKAVQIRTYQLALEKLEDRLTPGETLSAALPLSSFVCPYLALLGADVMRQDAPAPVVHSTVVADAAPQAQATQGVVAPAAPVAAMADSSDTSAAPAQEAVANPPMDDSTDIQPTPLAPSASDAAMTPDPANEALSADPATLDASTPADVTVQLAANDPGNLLNGNALMGAAGSSLVIAPAGSSAVVPGPSATATNAASVNPAIAAALAAGDAAGDASPLLIAHATAAPGRGGHPLDWNGTPNPPFTPAQIKHAYGFDLVSNQGSGQTIYIVDAYNDPNIASDLNTFDSKFGLPSTTLTVHKMSKHMASSTSWGLEESLDVEWAHAIAPQAKITLVEATSASYSALFSAINWATTNGAHVVSMSWGGGDSSGESAYDSYFNHSGVTYIASSGDSGGVVEYPSASPYVLSTGGTSLTLTSSGNYGSESAWSSGGGGASLYESEPTYQKNFGISLSGRGTPDVSYDADPNTGVYVYDSYLIFYPPGWYEVGGTSAAAPQWAALIALADQSRATPLSTNNLTSRSEYNAAAGSLYGTNYHDITTGSNGYSAGPGYDLATGIGGPQANNLIGWLTNNS